MAICTSTSCVQIIYNFHGILCSGFMWGLLTHCSLLSIQYMAKILGSKWFQMAEKMIKEFPDYTHIYKMWLFPPKFFEILCSVFKRVALTNCSLFYSMNDKISIIKRAKNENNGIRLSC